jgi:hypothetical protein
MFCALLQPYGNQDPASNRKKDTTPRLFQALFQSLGVKTLALQESVPSTTANIVIGSFSFACQACDYTKTKLPSKTKVIVLSGVILHSKTKKTLQHRSTPSLLGLAEYVTIIFVD